MTRSLRSLRSFAAMPFRNSDFADLALVRGAPPKVIWLRCGNSTVAEVEQLLRWNLQAIHEFDTKPDSPLLEIWP